MRVLIVDDLPVNRRLLRAILTSAGHETAEAPDGVEALEALRYARFDVVVTDVLMPRMDGYRLCHEMREREELRQIPVVVYTSTYTSPADETAAMKVGADRFLRKPAPPQEILDVLASVVRQPRPAGASEPLGDLDAIREYSEALVRKLEEKNGELERSEKSLRDLVELSPVGIYQVTPEGTIVSANAALAEMLGYRSAGEVTGLDMERDVYSDPAERAGILSRFELGEREIEVRWKRKDGVPTWVQIDGRIVRGEGGAPRLYEAFVRDINARKQAEAESVRSLSEAAARRRRSGLIDIAVLAAAAVFTAYLSHRYDLFTVTARWLEAHEPSPIDEILSSLVVLSVLFGVFSFRRWRDMRLEMSAHERTERDLRRLSAELESRVASRTAQVEKANRDLKSEVESRRLAQETASKLDLAVEQSGNVIFMTDLEGRITFANPAFTTVYGYSPGEVLGRNPRLLKSGLSGRDFYERFWKAMISGAGFRGEIVNRAKDGRLVTVDTVTNGIFDPHGQRIGYVAVQNDITERKAAESAVRASEQRIRALMENAKDAIYVSTTEGIVLQVNRAAEELEGRPRSEIEGSSVVEIVAPEERERVGLSFARTITERSISGFETVMLRVDGTHVPVEVSASLVDVGEERLVYAVVRDVSGRKKLEQQFRQAQKLEAVGRLAGSIAHDFNNLMMVVQGVADVMPLHAGNEAAQKRDLDNLRMAAQRGGTLTRQILAFSRPQVPVLETMNAGSAVGDLSPMIERLIGENIRLSVELPSEKAEVRMDRSQLEQIVMNLVVNARDAMPTGGRLTIEVSEARLDSAFAARSAGVRPGPFVMVAVSDDGTGMSREVQERIFEPFFTTKEPGRGTGLGLATVYGIVKSYGGDIRVDSEPGRGSVFKVYLPRTEASGEARRAVPAGKPATWGTETVLLVEDEKAIRETMQAYLEGNGYRVFVASSGTEGLELLAGETAPIHVLVTDVVLPGRAGLDVAKAALERDPNTRVIFTSGYTDDAEIGARVLSEGLGFLQKPFELNVLVESIRAAIDRTG